MLVVFLVKHQTMHAQIKFLSGWRVAGLHKEAWILKFKVIADYFTNSCYNLLTRSVVTVVNVPLEAIK